VQVTSTQDSGTLLRIRIRRVDVLIGSGGTLFLKVFIGIPKRVFDAHSVSKGSWSGFMKVKLRQVVPLSSRFNTLNKNSGFRNLASVLKSTT
jgi:hypothetical protein